MEITLVIPGWFLVAVSVLFFLGAVIAIMNLVLDMILRRMKKKEKRQ